MANLQKPVKSFSSNYQIGDAALWWWLSAYFTFLCVGAAWLLVATPYYFLFLRNCKRKSLILHSIFAGFAGFFFMILATQLLPKADDSWRFLAPIAFAAGLCGVIVSRLDLFDPRTKQAEQAGAGQTAIRPLSDSQGGDQPQPEAEGRSR